MVTFTIDARVGHRAQWSAIQLQDSSYVIVGGVGGLAYTPGWAAKISKTGTHCFGAILI